MRVGVLLALCAVGMAAAPRTGMAARARTEIMFVVFTSLYNFTMGFCYAAFGAVVLESIGTGAAATKYNVLAAFSNGPIIYQTLIDGWGDKQWHTNGLSTPTPCVGVAGVAIYYAVAALSRSVFPGQPARPRLIPAGQYRLRPGDEYFVSRSHCAAARNRMRGSAQ